jgi:release factor glutamine methyltransferase
VSTRQLKKAKLVSLRLVGPTNGMSKAVVHPTAAGPCRETKPFPFVWSLDRTSNVGRAMLAATRRLKEAGSETPQLDAAVLMAHVLGVSKTWLYAHPNRNLTEEEITRFEGLVRRRMAHEPVAYLVGYRSFFGLDITVDSRVLIPRPETEQLVEKVVAHARRLVDDGQRPRIVDVGTGSGAIAVAIAVNVPEAIVYATDLSDDALAVAAQNVWRYGLGEQVQLLPGSLLEPLPEPVHIVVANLPYIAMPDLKELPCEVIDFEPVLALNGGPDGLAVIRDLLTMLQSPEERRQKLLPDGRVYLEIGYDQGPSAQAEAQEMLPDCQVEVLRDYADRDRILIVRT